MCWVSLDRPTHTTGGPRAGAATAHLHAIATTTMTCGALADGNAVPSGNQRGRTRSGARTVDGVAILDDGAAVLGSIGAPTDPTMTRRDGWTSQPVVSRPQRPQRRHSRVGRLNTPSSCPITQQTTRWRGFRGGSDDKAVSVSLSMVAAWRRTLIHRSSACTARFFHRSNPARGRRLHL